MGSENMINVFWMNVLAFLLLCETLVFASFGIMPLAMFYGVATLISVDNALGLRVIERCRSIALLRWIMVLPVIVWAACDVPVHAETIDASNETLIKQPLPKEGPRYRAWTYANGWYPQEATYAAWDKWFPSREAACKWAGEVLGSDGVHCTKDVRTRAWTFAPQDSWHCPGATMLSFSSTPDCAVECPVGWVDKGDGKTCIRTSCPQNQGWSLQGTKCVRPDCSAGEIRDTATGQCKSGCAHSTIPAWPSYPRRTLTGAFVYGGFGTPEAACANSIAPTTSSWYCGNTPPGQPQPTAADACKLRMAAIAPSLAERSFVLETKVTRTPLCQTITPDGSVYTAPGDCYRAMVDPIPVERGLVYSPESGNCLNAEGTAVYNVASMKTMVCPGGGSWTLNSSTNTCCGDCPDDQTINVDTFWCDAISGNVMAKNQSVLDGLTRQVDVVRGMMNYRSGQ